MCCFAQSVQSVANTRIFARLTGQGGQFLVYQMDYQSLTPNAMILPLPAALPAKEESIRFLSLKEYPQFFRDLDRGFPGEPVSRSRNLPISSQLETKSQLVVHDVGDYVASFVPHMDDFDRLDPRFVIPQSSWNKIPGYADYSFAVFQLKSLGGTVHPIAMEFQTRWPEQIFFPTVHIHDGEVHDKEHFDHLVYLQNSAWDDGVLPYASPEASDPATKFVRSKWLAKQFINMGKANGLVAADQLVHRKAMQGYLPNSDTIISTSLLRIPSIPNRAQGPLTFGLASLVALGGWLVWRREKLRAQVAK